MNQNFDEFSIMLNNINPPLLIAIAEMWPNDDIETGLLPMEIYFPIRMTEKLRRGGGVAILVSNDQELVIDLATTKDTETISSFLGLFFAKFYAELIVEAPNVSDNHSMQIAFPKIYHQSEQW